MTTQFATNETTSKIFSKRDFQQLRKDFKAQGLNIEKTPDGNGYQLALPDGRLLLKAMNGTRGYLVRYVSNLFA